MQYSENHNPTQRRESMLTIILTGLGAGGFLLFLMLVTLGFFFYVVLAVAVITGLGFFHYLLWGHSMTLEVEEEQTQIPLARRVEDVSRPDRPPHKRF